MTLNLIKQIEEIVEKPLLARGYSVVRIQLSGMKRPLLQLMIERSDETPVTLGDCEEASRLVSTLLDVDDVVHSAYTLEVSSAGLERPLVKPQDYKRFCGFEVVINRYQAVDGRKRFQGKIESVSDKGVQLLLTQPIKEGNGQTIMIPFSDIRSAHLHVDFKR